MIQINIRKGIASNGIKLSVLVLSLILGSCVKEEKEPEVKLETSLYTEVGPSSCIVHGKIIDMGGHVFKQYGFCYSDSEDPTVLDKLTRLGERTTTGSFSDTLINLASNTTYYFRAYAQTSDLVYYDDQKSFTTAPASIPVISPVSISLLTQDSAIIKGEVISDGGAIITSRGICWSTSESPTISDNRNNSGTGIGVFSSTITQLSRGTTYYVRAYATNSVGTGYGEENSFTTSEPQQELPVVTTTTVSGITMTTAQSGGNVTDDGGGAVTEKGVCWSTDQNPTISDAHSSNGSGSESYTSTITGLICSQKYYVRAYATNSSGTSYGEQIDFQTDSCIVSPTVSTVSISNITETSALSGGVISNDGGASITAKGVCWSKSSNPTTSDKHTNDGTGVESFISIISELACDATKYYVRAYATNSAGTNYGELVEFTTDNCTTVKDFEGNVYQIVTVGSQVWMAENLRSTRYADGTAIPLEVGSSNWDALELTDKAYCFYDNNSLNGNPYGALYTWAAAMNGETSSDAFPSGVQGVCPSGWHMPSEAEYKTLETYIGGSLVGGGKLKNANETFWSPPNTEATNEFGFNALPAGYRDVNGNFLRKGEATFLWTSKDEEEIYAWFRPLYYDGKAFNSFSWHKQNGFSVRCLKNE